MNDQKQDALHGPSGDGSADLEQLRAELGAQDYEPAEQILSGEFYSFGPARGNRIPVEYAAELLYRLHSRDPDGFGIELLEMTQERVLGRTDLSVGKRRNRKPKE